MISSEFSGVELTAVTGVYYTDPADIRFELSLETAENMRNQDIPYVVVNSSPVEHTWIVDAHTARGAVVVAAEIGGLATQRLQAAAYVVSRGAEKIVSAEPEKTLMPFFKRKIAGALDVADVLVISRTRRAEASLPPVQLKTEHLAGWILEETLELPRDSLSGGRGFTVAGAEVLACYPATEPGMNNWIYLYETPLAARAAGLRIKGIDVDLIHPKTMVAQETGNEVFDRKRYDQFKLQLDYMLQRTDILPYGQAMAKTVLAALKDITPQTPNEVFAARIQSIADGLASVGYRPPRK